jgi:hypothetical protein
MGRRGGSPVYAASGGFLRVSLIFQHQPLHVLERCDPVLDEPDRLKLQRLHPVGQGVLAHRILVDQLLRLEDDPPQFLVDHERLVDADTAPEPADAVHAPDRLEELRFGDLPLGETAFDQEVGVDVLIHHLAPFAELPDQALGHDDVHRVGEQERLDAHVIEARDRADGVVGVQRREDQVAGVGELHRKVGGDLVAHLAHHHDIGVVAEDAAQRPLEVELVVQLDLPDPLDEVFDGVFDR